MLTSTSVRTLQGEPILINLRAGDALECKSGSIWATLSEKGGRSAPEDEFLNPGDSLVSCSEQTYCVSAMRKSVATFRVVASPARPSLAQSDRRAPCGDGYTLRKASQVLRAGALA